MGGVLASVREFLRSKVGDAPTPEIKCDLGGDDAVTAYHFAPPGVDAQPLPGDLVYLGDDVGAGVSQALGYQDPKNEGQAGPGEFRIYSRSDDGAIVAEVWIKADGSIAITSAVGAVTLELGQDGKATLSNDQGSAELAADGSITLTAGQASAALGADGAITIGNSTGSVAIDAAGNVTATTPLGQFGAGTHTHTTPFGPSGPPIPGT